MRTTSAPAASNARRASSHAPSHAAPRPQVHAQGLWHRAVHLWLYTPDGHGGHPPGGAATVLCLPLDPAQTLQSLELRALSTEVVIGLLAASLVR